MDDFIDDRWKAATKTLAKLHAIPHKSVGLEKFGRATGYYIRQMRTFKTISEAQAATVDIKTGKKVGPVPHFNELLDWFAKHLPEDRTSIVHGDYKIDNMVVQKTKELTCRCFIRLNPE
jgi:aminoglycoside phosphotransferase (APT) family kinase protein